jgi:hypothetical protein
VTVSVGVLVTIVDVSGGVSLLVEVSVVVDNVSLGTSIVDATATLVVVSESE